MLSSKIAVAAFVVLLCQPVTWSAEVVAVAGKPFGVGRIIMPLASIPDDVAVQTNGYLISERSNRVFYPAFAHRRVLGMLGELIGIQTEPRPSSITVYFLFTGDQPLELTLQSPQQQTIVAVPRHNSRLFQRLQRTWWQQYASVTRLQEKDGDYPPLVEIYLSTMLSQRLGLRVPLLDRIDRRPTLPRESLLLALNVESMRMQVFEDTLLGRVDIGTANRPVPREIEWSERNLPAIPDDVAIEPIALQVPEECFYIRFGSFDNYLWAREFAQRNGGSAHRLMTLRGHDAMLSQRLQEQLGLKETVLAELLGNQLISDVALIGRDVFMREGAAIGIVFEARNNLLKRELMKQRREAASKIKDGSAYVKEVTIGDRDVSFAASPDNRLRSIYVTEGAYHLVTNSKAIAARFIESGRGEGALGNNSGFRVARGNFPSTRQDALFAYLSPEFFRGLVSPQYQIEVRRRLKAVTDMEIVKLARLAAEHEGHSDTDIPNLVATGLLPERFQQRPDGSYVVVTGERIDDSLRGGRGHFLPIPDVPLEGMTEKEERRFEEIARFHERRWSDMDPLVLQVRRFPLERTSRELIEVRAEMLPFDRQKYGLATSIIGPKQHTRIQQPKNDAITLQIVFQGSRINPNVKTHHLFFGIQDKSLPIELSTVPVIRWIQTIRQAPAYFGAWPPLGLVDLIPLRENPVPDANGMLRLPFGLWQKSTSDGFSLVGVDPQVLEETASDLGVAHDDTEAQIRLHVADVSESKIKTWLAALDFQRAYQTSVGNTRLMHTIHQQLGVPADDALRVTEDLLGVDLLCALGGDYKLFESSDGFAYWGSTHWPSLRSESDEGKFASPIMGWFRGLDAEIRLLDDRISADAMLEVEKLNGGGATLPFFDFLRKK